MLDAGVTAEAIHVAFLFSIIVRVADTFEFEIPPDDFASSSEVLLKRGYT